jgi:hypothetical protein
MKTKPILCPERLRHVPRQFSWIDHRLVRDRHIRGRSPQALALYLFLCTVADAQGASYYSDGAVGTLLSFSAAQVREARSELIGAGLIAYRRPFYQVLSLEPSLGGEVLAAPVPGPRVGGVRSAGEILRSMMEERP